MGEVEYNAADEGLKLEGAPMVFWLVASLTTDSPFGFNMSGTVYAHKQAEAIDCSKGCFMQLSCF